MPDKQGKNTCELKVIALYIALCNTIKPHPEEYRDMILFEVFLKNIHLIPHDQIVQ